MGASCWFFSLTRISSARQGVYHVAPDLWFSLAEGLYDSREGGRERERERERGSKIEMERVLMRQRELIF